MLVTSDTAIFCDPLDITALFAVRFELAIVEPDPVRVACLPSSCVCIAEETPSKYPISVLVTSLAAILPEPLDITALSAVKFELTTVDTAPPVPVSLLSIVFEYLN